MGKTRYTLDDFDQMGTQEAQRLPFEARDELLDLVLEESRKFCGKQPERQVGLMCDYFEEDVVRLLKLRVIRIRCGGFIPIDADGEVPSLDLQGQCELVFENMKKALKIAGTNCDRIVNCIIFMKNIDYWSLMNEVYRKYIKCSPTRAAIGCQELNKSYQIEIVNVIAYKVAE